MVDCVNCRVAYGTGSTIPRAGDKQYRMTKESRALQIVQQIVEGDRRLAARLMRDADDAMAGAWDVLAALFPHTGRAHIVGITGNPGAGKSTLVDQLIKAYRSAGKTVGVVAIDPSSPFSGGAILGDRIRMQDHALDPGVFIRSVATRGHLGGLSRSTDDMVNILDAMGFDVVLVETVGVGQDEVDIIRTAHTCLVVLVPGLGDEVQALKAGLLEIADIFVVNKADRDESARTVSDIEMMLSLRDPSSAGKLAASQAAAHHGEGQTAAGEPDSAWQPQVLKTVSTRGQGFTQLLQGISEHRQYLESSGELNQRISFRTREVFIRLLRDRVWHSCLQRLGGIEQIDAAVEKIASRQKDPYSQADLLDKLIFGSDGGGKETAR